MQRFHEILVLATPEPETLDVVNRAAQLADRNRARLTLFDVVPRLGSRRERVDHGGTEIDLQAMLVESRRSELEDLAKQVMTVDTRVEVAVGVPFHATIERVIEFEHDLVIAAPDRSELSRGLRGATTTLHLLRKCPCPVWVDDPASWERPDVLVALGPLSNQAEGDALSRTLLELGTSLSRIQGGRLHVVHAWRLEGENLMRNGRVHLEAGEIDALVDEERVDAEVAFRRVVGSVDTSDVAMHEYLRRGNAADTIADVVDEVKPGVVVMGTLARAGLRGLIIGNTAERLLGDLDASVIAVKPPGFVSPVAR